VALRTFGAAMNMASWLTLLDGVRDFPLWSHPIS
jgi:hypothetical protein